MLTSGWSCPSQPGAASPHTCTGSAWEMPRCQTGKKTLLILSLGFSYRPGGDCCPLILAAWVSFETPQGGVGSVAYSNTC